MSVCLLWSFLKNRNTLLNVVGVFKEEKYTYVWLLLTNEDNEAGNEEANPDACDYWNILWSWKFENATNVTDGTNVTNVITGTFWRVENLIFKCKQCNLKNAASVRTFLWNILLVALSQIWLTCFLFLSMQVQNQSKKGPQEKQI